MRSIRFIEAYKNGLDGTQAAAWAIKKYRGHRILSESIMKAPDAVLIMHDSFRIRTHMSCMIYSYCKITSLESLEKSDRQALSCHARSSCMINKHYLW
jgi:hypothetical protein